MWSNVLPVWTWLHVLFQCADLLCCTPMVSRKHVYEALFSTVLGWMYLGCSLLQFSLLLISALIQTAHIWKAKLESVIHKSTKKRPRGVEKEPYLFALHVNCGHFPIHSIFNYTEVEQEAQVSLREGGWGESSSALKHVHQGNQFSALTVGGKRRRGEGGRGRAVLIDQWGERNAFGYSRHKMYLSKDRLCSAFRTHTPICTEHALDQMQSVFFSFYLSDWRAHADGDGKASAWWCLECYLHMPRQLNKRSQKQI